MRDFTRVFGALVALCVAVLGYVNAPDFDQSANQKVAESATVSKSEDEKKSEVTGGEREEKPEEQTKQKKSEEDLVKALAVEPEPEEDLIAKSVQDLTIRVNQLALEFSQLQGQQGSVENSLGEIRENLSALTGTLHSINTKLNDVFALSVAGQGDRAEQEKLRQEIAEVNSAVSRLENRLNESELSRLFSPPTSSDKRCAFKVFDTSGACLLGVEGAPFRIPPGVKEGDFSRYRFYIPEARKNSTNPELRNSKDPRDNWICFEGLLIPSEHFHILN